jgi:hypothetical protein
MQTESATKRSNGYDVWFAEERTWTARVTCLAPAELYPGEKGPFSIFDCLQKILLFAQKCTFPEKSGITTGRPRQQAPQLTGTGCLLAAASCRGRQRQQASCAPPPGSQQEPAASWRPVQCRGCLRQQASRHPAPPPRSQPEQAVG